MERGFFVAPHIDFDEQHPTGCLALPVGSDEAAQGFVEDSVTREDFGKAAV